jgi:glycosyltransferase involved in cell wall biosynthesis
MMPKLQGKIKAAISVTNCICHDQRVIKMTGILSMMDCDVIIIGRKIGDCCEKDLVPFKTRRFRMIFRKGFLFYKFYNLRLFLYLLFHRSDLLISNDLDTLLPNYLISRLKRIPLIYDSHEYFTGVPELKDRPLVRWIWKSIERFIFPNLKYVLTVSDSIADLYEKEYSVRPLTVRNCSLNSSDLGQYSKTEIGIHPDHLLLILQGTGINTDRGGEELIDAIKITENVSLLIIGSGDLLQLLKQKVNELGLDERVKFISKIPWDQLIKYTRSADIGISVDRNTNVNYEFSLPNKVFDYISAGIPVIASDLKEIRKIVIENSCGLIIPEVTPLEISKAIIKLRDDEGLLLQLKKNAVEASKSVNWETESLKVNELYKSILQTCLKN